jgi:hypothetical protein
MANKPTDDRTTADSRFQKFQRTSETAQTLIQAERDSVRKKTARLKSMRLAKEAQEGKSELDKPAAVKKAKPKTKRR